MAHSIDFRYEAGGRYQVPLIAIPTSTIIKAITEQIEEMDAFELAWLKGSADNLSKLCLEEIQKRANMEA